MKRTSISILLVAAAFHMETLSAAGLNSRFQETLLTKSKTALEDPYYQLTEMNVRELSEEEALKFINEEGNVDNVNTKLVTKEFIGKIPGGIPPIPPVPPDAGNTDDGALSTGNGPGGNIPAPGPAPTPGPLSGIIAVIDDLIAIGTKIMPTIEKGRPVITNNPMASVSVLPRIDAKDPVVHDMANWSIPVSKHYRIAYKNGFGMEVVTFVYSISFQHSGTYNNKGHYLAGIRMAARDIAVSWGFDLDASSQLLQISNVGTSDNVIAGATVEISYTVKNWTRNLTTIKSFHVTGDGRIFQLD